MFIFMNENKSENNENVTIKNNRGIIYLLGFEWCNPNGDPAQENVPRIYGDTLFTTDVFLKRRIRDYIYDKYGKNDEETLLSSKSSQGGESNQKSYENKNIIFLRRDFDEKNRSLLTPELRAEKLGIKSIEDAKRLCWDVRVFGALITLEKDKKTGGKGEGWAIYGPAQFTFGTSINKVTYFDVQITNVLAHSEKKAKGGSIGVKNIVPVAIVEYFGFVNKHTAKLSGMTEGDYEKLIESLKNLRDAHSANTATKNIVPIILIDIEFNDNAYSYLKGLIKIEKDPVNSLRESKIDISPLISKIQKLKQAEKIKSVKIYLKEEFKDNILPIAEETIKQEMEIEFF